MKLTKEAKSQCLNQPMIFGKAPQEVIDHHYFQILDTLKTKDQSKISFLLSCINFIKDKDGYNHIRYAAQNAVMNGWLTVNESNQFVPRD